jgi:hypothetical protein
MDYTASNGRMTDERKIEKNMEGSGRDSIRYLPGGAEENHEKHQHSRCPAENRTEHIPIASLGRYRYINALGNAV